MHRIFYIKAIVLRTAVADVQWAADEIVLNVNHQECVYWSNNLY